MRLIDFRHCLARYLRKRYGPLDVLTEPTLTAIGDALWVMSQGDPERLPQFFDEFLHSDEYLKAHVPRANWLSEFCARALVMLRLLRLEPARTKP